MAMSSALRSSGSSIGREQLHSIASVGLVVLPSLHMLREPDQPYPGIHPHASRECWHAVEVAASVTCPGRHAAASSDQPHPGTHPHWSFAKQASISSGSVLSPSKQVASAVLQPQPSPHPHPSVPGAFATSCNDPTDWESSLQLVFDAANFPARSSVQCGSEFIMKSYERCKLLSTIPVLRSESAHAADISARDRASMNESLPRWTNSELCGPSLLPGVQKILDGDGKYCSAVCSMTVVCFCTIFTLEPLNHGSWNSARRTHRSVLHAYECSHSRRWKLSSHREPGRHQ